MLKNSPIGPHVLYDHNFSMLAWLTYMFQQECYPLGFGPPAGCGGLSNTSCICSDIAFAIAIAPCVVATCSLTERSSKSSVLPGSTFSQGGMSHSHHNGTLLIRFVSLIVNKALATILCGEPPSEGYPAIASINDAVSASVVAAASATPSSLGDPSQLTSFPMCAVS